MIGFFFLQETAAAAPRGGSMLTPNGGLIIWTLLIFIALMLILTRFAFRPIIAAVQRREEALDAALAQASRDRDEAAGYLEQQRALLVHAQAEAARVIADARAAAERVRAELIEKAHAEQQELLRRAREEIDGERRRAIAELRREAVDLAIRAAGKVIERNVDDRTNRELVEQFLATVPPVTTSAVGGPAA